MTKLSNVNTTDVRSAIQMGMYTMSSVFNADDNDIPFFGSEALPSPRLSFSNVHSESHVPGRHLNGLLTAEHVTGIAVDERAIEKHEAAAFFSYSGPVPLSLNRDVQGGPLANFNEHNVREGFHALYALARYRDSGRARQIAEKSIEFLLGRWDPQAGIDYSRLQSEFGIREVRRHTFITGIARAIGPLVKYYRATGHGTALELAYALADKATAEFFLEDGRYDRESFGAHTHSTTCVMSSLAQLADLAADSALLERVRAFYDNGLWDIRDEIGWVIESSADDSPPDRGECNNTGDILETALILGRRGYPRYYQDAERILRCHLLPSQLRDGSFIPDVANPHNEDGLRDVRQRHAGAFGFPAPYGHAPIGLDRISFNMDIVGGAVGSLCEALREAIVGTAAGLRINLLIDHETADADVSARPDGGGVTVAVKRAGPLWIRLPEWADRSRLEVSGAERSRVLGSCLFVPHAAAGQSVAVSYPVAVSEITLPHRTREIRAILHGDSIAAMDNFGAPLTFFNPIA